MRAASVCSALCLLLLFADPGASQGAPAPGTLQAVGLAPGPSLPVLPAGLSPLASLVGRVVAAEAQCPAADRSAAVYLALDGLPQSFSSANLACHFPHWQDVRNFNLTGGEVGLYAGGNQSAALLSYVQTVILAEGSSAKQQQVNTGSNAQSNESLIVQCSVPGSASSVAPVVMTQLGLPSGAQDRVLLVTSPLQQPLQRTIVQSFSPASGPSSGGTNITLQGEGLNQQLTCTFSNGSTLLASQAHIHSADRATCQTPSWPQINSTQVQLTVSWGSCRQNFTFNYYVNPLVSSVSPSQGPRYGSFDLTLNLEENLTLCDPQVRPQVMLAGAAENGTDLTIHAHVADNRRALMAAIPQTGAPLSPGQHPIKLSLNGQQFLDPSVDQPTLLSVEGPSVSMETFYIGYVEGVDMYSVSAVLEGSSFLPVTASLSISQRKLTSKGTVRNGVVVYQASPQQLRWDEGQQGLQNITITITDPGEDGLTQSALLLEITHVENADLVEHQSTSVITAAAEDDLIVSLTPVYNTVIYRPDEAIIPINIVSPRLQVPARVSYTLTSLTDANLSYIPAEARSGLIDWDLEASGVYNLSVPLEWDEIPPQAADRITLTLNVSLNAEVHGLQTNGTVLHIFGVEEGQCPPGTARQSNDTGSGWPFGGAPSPSPASESTERIVGRQLSGMAVTGSNGSAYDLSSNFKPDRADYGAMLPPEASNATLCLQPQEGRSQLAVIGPDGNSVLPFTGNKGQRHLRRSLLVEAPLVAPDAAVLAVPQEAPPPPTAPAVHAMASRAGNTALQQEVQAMCQQAAWMLMLNAGQNEFTIFVTPPGIVPQVPMAAPSKQMPSPSPSPSPALLSPSINPPAPAPSPQENPAGVYTLSVVRLADPLHAVMGMLNVSVGKQSWTVCGSNSTQLSATNSSRAKPPCDPAQPMTVNVSANAEVVMLQPTLFMPGVQGVRVEVNGQVLSQGGDTQADQIEDTSSTTIARSNQGFLPAAVIIGLIPGVPLQVPIVVIAEDDVTSNQYVVQLTRDMAPAGATPQAAPSSFIPSGNSSMQLVENLANNNVTSVPAAEFLPAPAPPRPSDWPIPPSQEPWCSVCPAGWATQGVDAPTCEMCPKGSFAAQPLSPGCTDCPRGTYASSWGSTHCNHCIVGTFGPEEGEELCTMCPKNFTNFEDGSSGCSIPVIPGTNLRMRYAVIVSFGVFLNGTSLDSIAAKVGVNAAPEDVLDHLIKLDTATAFNISEGDVYVSSVTQLSRRVLYVNVTATLGVDVPPGASSDDVTEALDLKNLSADEAIGLLSENPDKFLGRTTKALGVSAESDGLEPTRTESRPFGDFGGGLALSWWSILIICLSGILLLGIAARVWRKRTQRLLRSLMAIVCRNPRYSQFKDVRLLPL
ncbi:hypothetical protein WJX74_010253 [Apatococcus lobatus]|uniref:Tyrosine-protein kinase ephrin type A/B receptor-like domain-containing protein n=1 Tax=Apatococcus lobatus TaxID=904363 RepID=A0AAW1QVV6_9CHLO